MARTRTPLTMDRQIDPAAKERVAAHQAKCFCHPVVSDGIEPQPTCVVCGSARRRDAHINDGGDWHIDPLCKIRPGAKA